MSFLLEEKQEQQQLPAAEGRVINESFSSAGSCSPAQILHSISNAATAHAGTINPALAGGQWGSLCSEDQN